MSAAAGNLTHFCQHLTDRQHCFISLSRKRRVCEHNNTIIVLDYDDHLRLFERWDSLKIIEYDHVCGLLINTHRTESEATFKSSVDAYRIVHYLDLYVHLENTVNLKNIPIMWNVLLKSVLVPLSLYFFLASFGLSFYLPLKNWYFLRFCSRVSFHATYSGLFLQLYLLPWFSQMSFFYLNVHYQLSTYLPNSLCNIS